ncbi:hypothetical protein INP81_17365 [Comamonas thiooxydans]|uniref:hypothetical protein n=1 Tax=Comamonas thiooxydans TaxID=363952 RepID=UPI0018A46D27|nr:hypothetical protein [Comamonas thiooxydans]QOQ81105.1 hypothetical protein INP81_17365 [Comamonas thiooxydans]
MTAAAKMAVALAVALLLSLAGNVGLSLIYVGQRDAATLAKSDADHAADKESLARASADVCTTAVDALQLVGEGLKRERDQARAQAAAVAAGHKARADKILSTPAAVPGDACASAQVRVAELLASRKSGGGQ